MIDFVCIGDATQDNFFFIDDASVHCDINNTNCELTLRYGDKIPVEKNGVSLGGNAANVSVGLARLGIKTALATVFGDDERGVWIKKQLMINNVDLENCLTEHGRESNISSIIVFKGERTILSYHSPKVTEVEKIPAAKWLYLTSSAGRDSTKIFDLVLKSKNGFLAFNPSMMDIKQKSSSLKSILDVTDVLILNKEEDALLGQTNCKVKVVTDGAKGATVFENGKHFSQPTMGTKVVETTGAGDAFSSGFLSAMYYGMDLKTALSWGLKNSASVITKVGAIEGLLTKDKIHAT